MGSARKRAGRRKQGQRTKRTPRSRPQQRATRARRSSAKRAQRSPSGARKKQARGTRKATQKWSASVTQHSDALDLERSIFTSASPRRIAESLKRSAEASHRRKGTPLQSAMSMLNFYINRGGANLPARRKQILERAKPELRRAFGKEGR